MMRYVRYAACGVALLLATACADSMTMSPQAIGAESNPETIAYPTRTPLLFVADMPENRVFIFPHTENAIQGGSKPLASIRVNAPSGVATGANGTLYIASYTDNAVYLYHIGAATPFQRIAFAKPYAVAVDRSNDLYVDSTETGVVAEYPHAGPNDQVDSKPSRSITRSDIPSWDGWSPSGLATGAQNTLYIADNRDGAPCGCIWQLEANQPPKRVHPVTVQNSTTILAEDQPVESVVVAGRTVAHRNYPIYYLGMISSVEVYFPTESQPQTELYTSGCQPNTYSMALAANNDLFVADNYLGPASASDCSISEQFLHAVYAFHAGTIIRQASSGVPPFAVLSGWGNSTPTTFSTLTGVATWR
jgi:hypothetical protein